MGPLLILSLLLILARRPLLYRASDSFSIASLDYLLAADFRNSPEVVLILTTPAATSWKYRRVESALCLSVALEKGNVIPVWHSYELPKVSARSLRQYPVGTRSLPI